MFREAHLYVLHNSDDVQPYIEEHMTSLRIENPSMTEKWIIDKHNLSFIDWIRDRIIPLIGHFPTLIFETLHWLSQKPRYEVFQYTSYVINGCTFYTKEQDGKSTMQNSGVTLVAEAMHVASAKDKNPTYADMNYYGVIEHIWELDYTVFKIPVFGCRWVDNGSGVRYEDGFTLVDLNRAGHKQDPFILASQATQVFYVTDPADNRWSVVLSTKKRNANECDDENDANWNNECVSAVQATQLLNDDNNTINEEEIYVRDDHREVIYVSDPKSNPKTRGKKRRKRRQ